MRKMDALEHGTVQSVMNFYAGFVLPSRPETFGVLAIDECGRRSFPGSGLAARAL